jgi:hypothetical protein
MRVRARSAQAQQETGGSHVDRHRSPSLRGAVAVLLVPGGVLFAPLLLEAALLALTGGLGGLENRTVRQHEPPMNPTGWRDGS